MIHVWGRGDWGEWTNISFSLIFSFLLKKKNNKTKLLKLNYVWYIKDHVGLMKSIYDFMSKICPSAPLKLTHRPPQQNWSGSSVGERSCSCSLQRGELEFPALKSSFPSHSPLQVPSDGTAGRGAPSVSTACALHVMLCSGKGGWSLQEAAAPAAASAPPVLARSVLGVTGRAPRAQQGELWRDLCHRHLTAPQLSAGSWTDCLQHHTPLDTVCCLLGLAANAQTAPRFWGKSSVVISQVRIFQIM